MNVDEVAENQVWEWACGVYRLRVEKVEKDRGRGRDQGRFPDFVIGKNGRAVKAKAEKIQRENGIGALVQGLDHISFYIDSDTIVDGDSTHLILNSNHVQIMYSRP